jgi:hypothetical protein
MDERDEVFSEDMIGRTIIGCISHSSAQFLLLDDGRTIEISKDHLDNNEGYWVSVGTWKPVEGKMPARAVNGSTD